MAPENGRGPAADDTVSEARRGYANAVSCRPIPHNTQELPLADIAIGARAGAAAVLKATAFRKPTQNSRAISFAQQSRLEHTLFADFETRSAVSLPTAGAWRYAGDATTEILCVGYVVGDGEPQIWMPGDPIPAPFLEAEADKRWRLVTHNDGFERPIELRLLHPRFNWPLIPLEERRCTMSMALAAALPGSLEGCAAALGLPGKDAEGAAALKKLTRPRKPRKGERPGLYWYDGPDLRELLALLYRYCKRDVALTREFYCRLPQLAPAEQEVWQHDAVVNQRGFYVDVVLAKAAQSLAKLGLAAINAEMRELTDGAVTSVHQVARIKTFCKQHGHTLAGLTKRSVAAVLAHDPSSRVRRLLELRQEGGVAGVAKFEALLAGVEADGRLRGTLKYHGSARGRWSGRNFQPQNLRKPGATDLEGAVDAILAGDVERVRAIGAPVVVAADVSRCVVRAPPGRLLIGGDFSSIESRKLAWLCGEEWKLKNYRDYDRTGDSRIEPYCVTASRLLSREVTPEDEAGRQLGKTADLALGFAGGIGAWRRFNPDDRRTDSEIQANVAAWRTAHPNIVRFWRALERDLLRTVATGRRIDYGDRLSFTMETGTLFITLPSGRRLAYPEARLVPGKFEDSRQIAFKENANGGWKEAVGWYGSFVENIVQGSARDLLAAALLRLERHGFEVCLHVHDEVIAEIADDGRDRRDEFLQILTELPPWAEGLPIAAKVWVRKRYAEGNKSKDAKLATVVPAESEAARVVNGAQLHLPLPARIEVASADDDEGEAVPDPTIRYVPLADLVEEPLVDGKICCPFHDESTPSLHVYEDHFHCFGCGAHGDQLDWLTKAKGLDRDAAIRALETWNGPTTAPSLHTRDDEAERSSAALRLWAEAQPIAATLAATYLTQWRKLELAALPADIDGSLRFHARCPFGPGTRHPCLVALMRDVVTDMPTGIQRVALTPDGRKIERRMLGRSGVVKLWPAGSQLVVGEGLETTLAAALCVPYRGAPLRPAWAVLGSRAMARLPAVPGVGRLILLVDHDENGVGQSAAMTCTERWTRSGHTVVRLTPKTAGTDFNDIITASRAPS